MIAVSDKLITLKMGDAKNVAVSYDNAPFKLNDFVILTGVRNKNDIFEANFVHILKP